MNVVLPVVIIREVLCFTSVSEKKITVAVILNTQLIMMTTIAVAVCLHVKGDQR